MSSLTKRHPINPSGSKQVILHIVHKGHIYNIPKPVAEKYEDKTVTATDRVLPEDAFAGIEKKYTKPGVLLQGTRHREGLSQVEFAKKIKVTQADLSKMEHGKRSIGKEIAKRIEKAFGVNYRYFL